MSSTWSFLGLNKNRMNEALKLHVSQREDISLVESLQIKVKSPLR